MSVGEGIQNSYPFKLKGGGGTGEGSPDPSSQDGQVKVPQEGTHKAQGIAHRIPS